MMLAGNDVTDGPGEVRMATQNRVMMTGLIRCPAYRQQGAVLVIGMILLLILTVIGVTMMTSTTQDEKLSGNTKRGSDAFMAAEAGLQQTVKDLCTEFNGTMNLCEPENYPEDFMPVNPPNWYIYNKCDGGSLVDENGNIFTLPAADFGSAGRRFTVTYNGAPGSCESDESGFIAARFISTGEQDPNAQRTVHFNAGAGGEASWPAVFVNDNPDLEPEDINCDFDFGPSTSYLYDGRGGPALSTNTTTCASQIRKKDEDTDGEASGQLVGGVVANNPNPAFTSPEGQRQFFKELEGLASTRKVKGVENSNPNKDRVVVKQDLPSDMGTPGDPSSMETTIVYGNLNITGSLEGAGVLVVTGRADFGGTPHWDGIIVVLGGEVNIGGGGTANGFSGTLLVSNFDFGSSADDDGYLKENEAESATWDYDDEPKISWDVGGGGNALYNYGCQNLIDAAKNLADAGIDPTYNFPAPTSCPDMNGDGISGDGSFGSIRVFDWFEDVND
jgi:hypothetical protein